MARPAGRVSVRVLKNGSAAAARLNSQQLQQLVAATTAAVEGQAKQHLQAMVYDQPPAPSGYVRTGNLMGSVGSEVQPNGDGIVFATAEYATYVHEGTVHVSPRPFLHQALEDEDKKVAARAARIAGGAAS